MAMFLDPLSMVTVPIQQFFHKMALPPATAFVYGRRKQGYLITNWHVVSARNAETGALLLKGGSRPNLLRAQFKPATSHLEQTEVDIPIRDQDDNPLWLVHSNHHDGKRIDIVAIPFNAPGIAIFAVNEWANARLSISVGMEVFILGYPFGAAPPGLPVWKRGSIASEPSLVRQTTGYYLVDTASRPGMSGSPVILRSWTNHMVEPGMIANTDRPLNFFLGVYSGRLHAAPSETQIGMVWHESFIDEIIDGGRRDT